MITLKCSSKTNPKALCKAIIKNLNKRITIEAIGAGAVNQAMKAVAYANDEFPQYDIV